MILVKKCRILRAVLLPGNGKTMTLYQKMLVFYAVMALFAAVVTWFLSHDTKRIRLLSAVLVGATWPISFPVALMFSLF